MVVISRTTLALIVVLISACSSGTPKIMTPVSHHATASNDPTRFPLPLGEVTAVETKVPIPKIEIFPTNTKPEFLICSPILGYSISDLTHAVSNPFNPPTRLGSDNPHQAIDIAVIRNGISLSGDEVHAILPGNIAGIVKNRFPYGNAVLIETSFEYLAKDLTIIKDFSTPAPTLHPHPSLTCPEAEVLPSLDWENRSLYMLYAHLREISNLHLGNNVKCGDRIGIIGESGNALNPHLHIETRVGPSEARFNSISHYDSSATLEEMAGYCSWRVSGVFELIDPMIIIRSLR